MSHTAPHFAKSVLFACIDDRLASIDFEYIKEIGGAFCPALAGGGLAIVNETTRATALAQIVIAWQVNHITDVYLQSHTDCGAYRLAGITFDSTEAETERLFADLHEAEKLVRKALTEAGANPAELHVHLRVVDPAGQLVTKAAPTAAKA